MLHKIDKAVFKARRDKVSKQIGVSGILVIGSAKEYWRSVDWTYPYRQTSDFYYLTGLVEPDSVAVLIPGRAEGEFIVFSKPHDPEKELWEGFMVGQEGARRDYGADQAFPIDQLDAMMPGLLANRKQVYFDIGRDIDFDNKIIKWINTLKGMVRAGIHAPKELIDAAKILHEMRMFKDSVEIGLMKKSASIAVSAHARAMQACRPGMFEYEIAAEILYEFIRHGGNSPSFETIVGSGPNSCILHYSDNNKRIDDGDIIVVDAGVEYEYYSSDITRTYPANGKFTPEQKAIYEVVLNAQTEVIAMLKPGVTWMDAHETSERVITEGLVELGLLKGSINELLEKKACKAFYMHRIGHWIGLDNHDVGEYKPNASWRIFEPNMITSVEPGIYIADNHPLADKKWWNIGVRIEDDILLTENGCEVITKGLPKTVEEIEMFMKK